jgi:hypothetical protein
MRKMPTADILFRSFFIYINLKEVYQHWNRTGRTAMLEKNMTKINHTITI